MGGTGRGCWRGNPRQGEGVDRGLGMGVTSRTGEHSAPLRDTVAFPGSGGAGSHLGDLSQGDPFPVWGVSAHNGEP